MGFDETTIEEIVRCAEREGAPQAAAIRLEADLREALHGHRQRMERIRKHSDVLFAVEESGYNVTLAAEKLQMSREGVYKHLRKRTLSTETAVGVDTKAA